VEAVTSTVLTAQPGPVRSNKAVKVLIATRDEGSNLIGSCSPAQTDGITLLRPETSIGCHVSFTSEVVNFPAERVFATHAAFDSDTASGLLPAVFVLHALALKAMSPICSTL
ncbi:hypothetical protein CRUP_012779, partial [Coryphaenoides rupestris]